MHEAEIEAVFSKAGEALGVVSNLDRLAFDWRMRWYTSAHRHQIEPDGDAWTIWLLLAGRGAGKTRCAAEWIGSNAWNDPGSRSLVAAATAGDIRDTCFEGDSGLLNVIPPELVKGYNRSLSELILQNDSIIKGIPASEPDRFRGGQWDRAWADELASWVYPEDAMNMIMFALRLGEKPRLVATTTPKPRTIIRNLVARDGKDVAISRATTMSNLDNLAPTFRDQIMQYEGTALFRQEALGELIDPEEAGIIRRSWFRLWPADKLLPHFDWIVMSLDTAFTEKTIDRKSRDPDPTACSVWGVFTHEKRSNVMLLDCWEEYLGLPDLVRKVRREMNTAYGDDIDAPIVVPMFGAAKPHGSGRRPDILLIEDKGSGISLRQTLVEHGIEAYAYNPGRADKLSRLHIVSPIFAQRRVWLPESELRPGQHRSWCDGLVEQLCTFAGPGSVKNDDHVDACAQAIRLMMDKSLLQVALPSKEERERGDMDAVPRKARGNPYAA